MAKHDERESRLRPRKSPARSETRRVGLGSGNVNEFRPYSPNSANILAIEYSGGQAPLPMLAIGGAT